MSNAEESFLSEQSAARYVGCSVWYLRTLVLDGRLNAWYGEDGIHVEVCDVDELFESGEVGDVAGFQADPGPATGIVGGDGGGASEGPPGAVLVGVTPTSPSVVVKKRKRRKRLLGPQEPEVIFESADGNRAVNLDWAQDYLGMPRRALLGVPFCVLPFVELVRQRIYRVWDLDEYRDYQRREKAKRGQAAGARLSKLRTKYRRWKDADGVWQPLTKHLNHTVCRGTWDKSELPMADYWAKLDDFVYGIEEEIGIRPGKAQLGVKREQLGWCRGNVQWVRWANTRRAHYLHARLHRDGIEHDSCPPEPVVDEPETGGFVIAEEVDTKWGPSRWQSRVDEVDDCDCGLCWTCLERE